ncbi:class I SAM-dependent methyltransferase [Nibribacter koreensis]
MRKPFQGVLNIIRFNWHFYVIALFLVLALILVAFTFLLPLKQYILLLATLIVGSMAVSLIVSWYVYDVSNLYQLQWIDDIHNHQRILNINAGFDETSHLLKKKFPAADILSYDFYDPVKHTEVSIKRARKAYPAFAGTIQGNTHHLELPDNSMDKIFVTLAAHEVRNELERGVFFRELERVVKPTGQIYITEHLRDVPNFLAYNIGFFHFYSKSTWLKTFQQGNLTVHLEKKITPFISTFILVKNGSSS